MIDSLTKLELYIQMHIQDVHNLVLFVVAEDDLLLVDVESLPHEEEYLVEIFTQGVEVLHRLLVLERPVLAVLYGSDSFCLDRLA